MKAKTFVGRYQLSRDLCLHPLSMTLEGFADAVR
jgi:hypothetical protein